MARFRKGRHDKHLKLAMSSTASQMGYEVPLGTEPSKPSESAWQARRRRRRNKILQEQSEKETKPKRNLDDLEFPEDEYDPYESDPGESYREHCERLDDNKTRTCLAIPKFLAKKDSDTVATAPASPFSDDSYEMPASLPRDLARVRYSLRSAIGDGSSEVKPKNMEQRELRPNNVHINVSHWSDFGGRNYMEDR